MEMMSLTATTEDFIDLDGQYLMCGDNTASGMSLDGRFLAVFLEDLRTVILSIGLFVNIGV